MKYIDRYFSRREAKSRRNYEIEDLIYTELEGLTKIYDASTGDLINAAIRFLIETEDIANYVKDPGEITVTHTIMVKQSNLIGLEELKAKYDISIYKLVNIAIRNFLRDSKE